MRENDLRSGQVQRMILDECIVVMSRLEKAPHKNGSVSVESVEVVIEMRGDKGRSSNEMVP